jgi:hypothetical protein
MVALGLCQAVIPPPMVGLDLVEPTQRLRHIPSAPGSKRPLLQRNRRVGGAITVKITHP